MKCPKYISQALDQRAKLASRFMELDYMIAEFLDRNDVFVEDYDIRGGCESYVNPFDSSRRILEAIENKED